MEKIDISGEAFLAKQKIVQCIIQATGEVVKRSLSLKSQYVPQMSLILHLAITYSKGANQRRAHCGESGDPADVHGRTSSASGLLSSVYELSALRP